MIEISIIGWVIYYPKNSYLWVFTPLRLYFKKKIREFLVIYSFFQVCSDDFIVFVVICLNKLLYPPLITFLCIIPQILIRRDISIEELNE